MPKKRKKIDNSVLTVDMLHQSSLLITVHSRLLLVEFLSLPDLAAAVG